MAAFTEAACDKADAEGRRSLLLVAGIGVEASSSWSSKRAWRPCAWVGPKVALSARISASELQALELDEVAVAPCVVLA